MKQSRSIRWGVIGLGWFGEVHAEVLASMPGIELAAVCTRRADRLEEVADRFDVPRRYTDYREMLADAEIDALSVVTHYYDHCQIAVDALAAGKNVFLEKPMAANVAECDKIVAAARAGRGRFMVGHICRFDPRVALAKEAIDEGRIGRIISMHARRNLSKVIGRQVLDKISALVGDGIHDADLMLWFSGARPVSVYAQEVHPGTNKYPDARLGHVPARQRRGGRGRVDLVPAGKHALSDRCPHGDHRHRRGAVHQLRRVGLEIHDAAGSKMPDTMYWPKPFGGRFGILRCELRYFADCVLEGRNPERITPEESRAAVALMEAATESAHSGTVITMDGIAGYPT